MRTAKILRINFTRYGGKYAVTLNYHCGERIEFHESMRCVSSKYGKYNKREFKVNPSFCHSAMARTVAAMSKALEKFPLHFIHI